MTTELPRSKYTSSVHMPPALRTPLWPITNEAAEGSESESASSSDSESDDPGTQASPTRTSPPSKAPQEASTDRVPVPLPQRPSHAVTRDPKRPWLRHSMPVRMDSLPPMENSHLSLLQNEGLALADCHMPASASPNGAARSQDRIRAAQRLFHALGQSARMEHRAPAKETPKPSRISILRGLRLQAQRRHSRGAVENPARNDDGEPTFATNMQGTQHCVIATQNSTFELVVTPPTPRTDEQEWEHRAPITGVRLSSHKMAHTMPPLPPSPQLQPPPFELAPGRARQLASRKMRQEQEERAWTATMERSMNPPCTQVTPASSVRMRVLTQWNAQMAEQSKFQGAQNPIYAHFMHGRSAKCPSPTYTFDLPKYVPP